MEARRDDLEARQQLLEQWAEEQKRRQLQQLRADAPSAWTLRYRLILARIRLARAQFTERLADRLLDRGLDTAGSVHLPEHEHPDYNHYLPSAWHVVPRALHYLGVSERDTFIDFGCGKGRVVHQAAKRPFHRVIGVEISPELAERARAMLAARSDQHRCRSVEIVVSDVCEFPIPDDFTIGYLFHPFMSDVFSSLLERIIESIDKRPRRIRLIYALPLQGQVILATNRFRLLKEQQNKILDSPLSRTAIYESI